MDASRAKAITLPADGRFPSKINGLGMAIEDYNGFATVQVLRALGSAARNVLGTAIHDATLGVLLSCQNPQTGGFQFWPLDQHPSWAPQLPDDADDTALMSQALFRAGHISLVDLRRIACHTVVCHRISAIVQPGPPWLRPGVFKTWMNPQTASNNPDVIDCTVNANVMSLLAAANLTNVPGYAEACTLIKHAVTWAGDDEQRITSLSPFYPEPGELMLSIEASVNSGAAELRTVLTTMQASSLWQILRKRSCSAQPTICGSAYGLIRWTNSWVGWARKIGGIS